jgi:hypothetical protein
MGPFSIQHVSMGPVVTHPWSLQFVISLHSVLSPSDVYLQDPSTSNLWDPMAYVSRVPKTVLHLHPTYGTWWTISIRPVGPDGLRVTWCLQFVIKIFARSFCIRPVGPDSLRVTCTCGTFLHLHPTCGTRQFACHLYHVCRHGLISQKRFYT